MKWEAAEAVEAVAEEHPEEVSMRLTHTLTKTLMIVSLSVY
jgi:hypothetical protein